ncbi:MAG: YihY/virulence factor BrkB family protein [Gemmatimonadota bacterium]
MKAVHHRLSYRAGEFLRRLWTKSYEDDVFFMAGAISFNLLLALIPLLVLGIGVAGYILSARFGDPAQAILQPLEGYLPAGGEVDLAATVRSMVRDLVERRGGLTLLGSVFFVWVATRLAGSVRATLREIFDVGRARGIVSGKLFDIQVVIVGVVLLTLNLGVTVVFEAAVNFGVSILGLDGGMIAFTQRAVAYGISFTSIWILFLVVYRYLPVRRIPWRTALVAATFAAVCHELLKAGFSWYATEVANYRSTWGNLATVVVLVFWIYYEAVVFILGGEVGQVYTMRKASRVDVRATFQQAPEG